MTSFLIAVPLAIEEDWQLHNYLEIPEYFYDQKDGIGIPAEHVVAIVWAEVLQQQYNHVTDLPEYCYGLAKKQLDLYELPPYPDNITAIHREAEKIVDAFKEANPNDMIVGLSYGQENPLDSLLATGEPFLNIPHVKSPG